MTHALQQAEALLQERSLSEKAQLAKWLSDDLSYRLPGVEKTAGVCGGSACIVRTRIPVWLLVEALHSGASEAQLLLSYPALRAEDLTNAWAYYRVNKKEIDQEILKNHC